MSACLHGLTWLLLDGFFFLKEIWYLRIFQKSAEKIQVWLKSVMNNRYSIWRPMYIYDNISLSSSWYEKYFGQNWREKTRLMFNKDPPPAKICSLCDNVGKCPARQVTDNIIIGRREDAISCWIAKARIQTHTRNMKYLLLFRSNGGYANAPQCYVVHILPVLFKIGFWHISYLEWLLHLFEMSHDVVRGCQATWCHIPEDHYISWLLWWRHISFLCVIYYAHITRSRRRCTGRMRGTLHYAISWKRYVHLRVLCERVELETGGRFVWREWCSVTA